MDDLSALSAFLRDNRWLLTKRHTGAVGAETRRESECPTEKSVLAAAETMNYTYSGVCQKNKWGKKAGAFYHVRMYLVYLVPLLYDSG